MRKARFWASQTYGLHMRKPTFEGQKLMGCLCSRHNLEQGEDAVIGNNDKLRKLVMDYNNDQYRALSKALSNGSLGKTKDTSADLAGRVSNDNNKQGSN